MNDDGCTLIGGVLYDDVTGSEAEPIGEEPAAVLRMQRADRNDASYGIRFVSVETVDVAGSAAYAHHHPHRVQVWGHELVLDAESVMIACPPVKRSPRAGTVREGDLVVLNYPDGVDRQYRVRGRKSDDPLLEPVEGQTEPDVSAFPEVAVAMLDDAARRQLLLRVVQVLEYDRDGRPGGEWNADTLMVLSNIFGQYGIRFTEA